MNIFFTVLYQPLYNLLIVLYNIVPWGGLGLAIILVTILVKLILLPVNYKALKAQKEMQEIQPKIKEIQAQYKDKKDKEDQAKMAAELMAIYKTHNVNPFASCLPTVVQLFVLIALYRVLGAGVQTVDPQILYGFVHNPGTLAHMFLGVDLSAVSIPLGILAAIAQYFQAKQMVTGRPPQSARPSSGALDEDVMAMTNKAMLYVLPVLILVIGCTSVPGGLTLYMLISTVVTYTMYTVFLKDGKVK